MEATASTILEKNNDDRKGTILSSCITLIGTTMGVGFVSCAYGFSQIGYGFGSILYCICCICSFLASHLMSCCILTCNSFPSSFYSVTHRAAPNWTTLIDLIVAVKGFLMATSYLIVVGDNVPDGIKSIIGIEAFPGWLNFRYVISIGVVAVIPLVCQRNFSILRYSSTVTAVFASYIIIMVLLYAFGAFDPCVANDHCRGDTIAASFSPTNLLPVLGIFVLNFTHQHNLFTVCNELRDLSLTRVNIITQITLGFCLLCYLLLSLGVYWTFGSYTYPDFLRNYPLDSVYVGVARVGLSMSILMSYPLQILPSRRSVITLVQAVHIWWLRTSYSNSAEEVNYSVMQMSEPLHADKRNSTFTSVEEDDEPHDFLVFDRHLSDPELLVDRGVPSVSPDSAGLALFSAVTVCLVVLSYSLAISGLSLRIVLELAGTIGSTSITYIIPAFLYMRLHTAWKLKRFGALFLLITGCCVIPISVVYIFLWNKNGK